MNEEKLPAHRIIEAAQTALRGEENETSLIPRSQTNVEPYRAPMLPTNATPEQKFGDLPTQLRDQTENGGVDLYEVKRLNLAAALESLERTTQSHENFPSPDAAFAVASLSEQVLKLTRDLEKSTDPRRIYDDILYGVMQDLTNDMIRALSREMKSVQESTKEFIHPDKSEAFKLTLKDAVLRLSPAMEDALQVAKNRLLKILNIKSGP